MNIPSQRNLIEYQTMPFVSKKELDALKECTEKLMNQLKDIKDTAYVIGIERKGRVNVFTFVRGEKIYKIETMGLISDDLPAWKEQLLR